MHNSPERIVGRSVYDQVELVHALAESYVDYEKLRVSLHERLQNIQNRVLNVSQGIIDWVVPVTGPDHCLARRQALEKILQISLPDPRPNIVKVVVEFLSIDEIFILRVLLQCLDHSYRKEELDGNSS